MPIMAGLGALGLVVLAQVKSATPEPPAARALVDAGLLDRAVRAALPLTLDVPLGAKGSAPAVLVDARSCGLDGQGRGRVLTLWTTGPGEAALLRAADDCKATPTALAARSLPRLDGKPVALAELAVAWREDSLRLSVERVALAGDKDQAAAGGLRALAARPALAPVPAGPLAVGAPGARSLLAFAAEWRPAGLAVAVAGGPRAAAPAGGPPAAPKEGLALELPFPFLNALLEAATRREPLRIRVDPEEIEVTEVRLARGGAGPILTGRATPRSVAQPFHIEVDLGGNDLQVIDVRASAVLEDCASQGIVERISCNARNAGRNTAAAALAGGLRAQYRGRLVRALLGQQALALELAGVPVVLRPELLRLWSHEGALRAEATAHVAR
jgi:hypothetical protein